MTRQNGLVRRLMLVAIGLCALLWTATARTPLPPPDDVITLFDVASCVLTADSHAPSESDREWRAQHHAVAAVTESLWTSTLVHAELAAVPAAAPFDAVRATRSDPPARSAPHYLRHTPLLI